MRVRLLSLIVLAGLISGHGVESVRLMVSCASQAKGMKHRVFVFVFLLFAIGAGAWASCGTSSCPLDLRSLTQPARGGFTLDLSYQYIDQDQPRIGTRKAHIGKIPGEHHDEVRTVNRITTALLTWAPTDRVALSVGLPFVSRDHNHLGSSDAHGRFPMASEHNVIPESWHLDGIGDVVLEGRVAIANVNPATRSGLWAIGGVKLPTGAHDLKNHDGEVGELPMQPGSGATDGLVGLSYQGGIVRPTASAGDAGNFAIVPYFVTATYQFRTGDADGYRLGSELQLSAGGAYPLLRNVDVLLQVNSRFRAKDRIDESASEEEFTGGTFVYASPGARLRLGSAMAVYALVQLPVYQDVNALQLTSDANYVVGVQTRF